MTALKDKIQNTLDECRMLILGGQVLISFAAEAVLEPGFEELPRSARIACAVGITAQTFAVVLLMWPAAYHQIACHGNERAAVHRFATKVLCFGLLPFAIGLGALLSVVGERIAGGVAAAALGGAAALAALAAWYWLPWRSKKTFPSFSSKEQTMDANESRELSDKIRNVLTEARMVLPGAQALLGFGSIAVLMDAFERLPDTLKAVHIVGLCFIAVAVILLMTPAAYHRIAEGGEETDRFHRVATRLLLGAMAALAPGLGAAVWIVVERATGSRAAGVITAGSLMAFFYGACFGWTTLVRLRGKGKRRARRTSLKPA